MTTATKVDERQDMASSEYDEKISAKPKISRRLLVVGILAIGLVGGLLYWLHARHYETTDDAQVDGHFTQLSTRISGTVTYVNPLVENDRYVSAGTLLLQLDPRDYEADLEHAKATLETKEAEVHVAQLQIPITDASAFSQLHVAEAEIGRAHV